MEDLSYVVLLREKFNYLESIPGVLLPHPSSTAFPFKVEGCSDPSPNWACNGVPTGPTQYYDHFAIQPPHITPSMTSLEALLSKLPSVVPTPSSSSTGYHDSPMFLSLQRPMETMSSRKVAKEEVDEEYHSRTDGCVSSMPSYDHFNPADQPN